jgi:hypothetical protein
LVRPAHFLASFVVEEISYMVIETRGLLHFATPENKFLQNSVFQDLQLGEIEGDHAYDIIYDLWVLRMQTEYGHVLIPSQASKPAGNILESYKMIAEQVLSAEPHIKPTTHAAACIEAAKKHLSAASWSVPQCHFPVHVVFETTYGDDTGCVIWLCDLSRAKTAATTMLFAFNQCRSR